MTQQRSSDRWITPAHDLPSLLALDNDAFVECGYLTILSRAPDPNGLAHYVNRLSQGHTKLEILGDIYGSAEARANNVRILWLERALWVRKLMVFSPARVLSKLFAGRSARISRQLVELEVRLNAIEKSVSLLIAAQKGIPTELAERREDEDRRRSVMNPQLPELTLGPELTSVLASRVYQALLDSRAQVDAQGSEQSRRR